MKGDRSKKTLEDIERRRIEKIKKETEEKKNKKLIIKILLKLKL